MKGMKHNKLDPALRNRIIALIKTGQSHSKTSKQVGVSVSTVWTIAVEGGLRWPSSYKAKFARLDSMKDMIQTMLDGNDSHCSTIAKRVGVSTPAVRAWIKYRKMERNHTPYLSLDERYELGNQYAARAKNLFHRPLNALRAA